MANTVIITISYDSTHNTYTPSPTTADVVGGDTLQITTNQDCTIFFGTNTILGHSTDVYTSPEWSKQLPGTIPNKTIKYCITALNGTCTPPSGITANSTGSIKVGSGTE